MKTALADRGPEGERRGPGAAAADGKPDGLTNAPPEGKEPGGGKRREEGDGKRGEGSRKRGKEDHKRKQEGDRGEDQRNQEEEKGSL